MQPVSGTVSLPCAGCFSPFPHGTCALSVSREYLALPDGPGGFAQDSTCPALLRIPLGWQRLQVQGCHLLWRSFPTHFFSLLRLRSAVLLPRQCRNTGGLGFSPVARHYWGNHSCFLFLQVLRCFSSLRWPLLSRCHVFNMTGCPIRKSWGQGSFAPNPSLSQLITSFVASESQGIHRLHLTFSLMPLFLKNILATRYS